ncbi:MAG TPA: sulfide/dihydroorotate dehydrogenase-like FAD/NAD-binding protein [Acidimicrobiia bacterium]|jgi:ferredoxin--NADP+ reductase
MHQILTAAFIAPDVKRFRVVAPRVARHWRPGQFVIVRPTPESERIPLTIVEADPGGSGHRDEGWIGLIVQRVGKTTHVLSRLEAGDAISDVAGPLGTPSEIERFGTVVVVGGGVGTAIVYPVATALREAGNRVVAVIGARTAELLILTTELAEAGAEVIVLTDDGTGGERGQVTDALRRLVDGGEAVDRVFAVGPIPMMRSVADVMRDTAIPTVVSLNPIMVDGTGMCGGCRVSVGGETLFACVDGPEFPAELVDFGLLAARNRAYADFEQRRNDEALCEWGLSRKAP